MRDGLYKVHFQTPLGWGAGVLYVSGGQLRGGDGALFYIGTYKQSGDSIEAEVTTGRHTHTPGIVSVFGRDQVRISLNGVSSGDGAKFSGKSPEAPGVPLSVEISRIAD